jgi:hypothetical protein
LRLELLDQFELELSDEFELELLDEFDEELLEEFDDELLDEFELELLEELELELLDEFELELLEEFDELLPATMYEPSALLDTLRFGVASSNGYAPCPASAAVTASAAVPAKAAVMILSVFIVSFLCSRTVAGPVEERAGRGPIPRRRADYAMPAIPLPPSAAARRRSR